MSKFNVGDEVVIIGSAKSGEIRIPIGSEAIVNSVQSEAGYYVVDADYRPWKYHSTSLQLKSEYDKTMENKTETQRIPFDLERARKGDKVIHDGDTGEYIFTNKGHSRTLHVFQFSVNNGANQAIMSFSSEGDIWYFGFGKESCDHPVFMAPVERTGWIVIMHGLEYITGETRSIAISTDVYDSEEGAIKSAYNNYSNLSVICTKQISWTE